MSSQWPRKPHKDKTHEEFKLKTSGNKDKKTDVPNKAKKSKDRKGKLRKPKIAEQDEEDQKTATSHSPPVKTGESRSPPRQNDEENQPTVFEKVGCPMRPFISPLKKKKKKLPKEDEAMKTAAEEEHSSGASLACESSDAKVATESNSHIKFDSHRLEDKKPWHRNNAKKTESQTSGSSHSSVTKTSSTTSEVGKEKEQPKSEEYFMVPGYEVRSEYVLKKSVDKSKAKKSTDDSSKEVKSSYFGYK